MDHTNAYNDSYLDDSFEASFDLLNSVRTTVDYQLVQNLFDDECRQVDLTDSSECRPLDPFVRDLQTNESFFDSLCSYFSMFSLKRIR